MEKLNIKSQEILIKNIIFLKYSDILYHKDVINNYFRRFDGSLLDEFNISLYPSNREHFFSHGISIFKIEDLILEVGLPNMELSSYKTKKHYLLTVRNNHINLTYNTEKHPVETEQDCIDYCKSIIDYMEVEGKAFVEKYSYLPNILKEMDRLVQEGKYWNGMYGKGGILTGLGDAYFRGLIISKLCNDVGFENKLIWVQNIFEEDQKWLPYYEKLKERLKSVEPVYNI